MTTIQEFTCEYFARCSRPAAGVTTHPILGHIPTCQPCADRFGLTILQVEFTQ